ncbi:DUF6972 family protein [Nostoc sp.]|uniref:DUF6972 family protein n=1 Tax=Nostoc sp. TaxID=1180 RepID=UPI003FA59A7B
MLQREGRAHVFSDRETLERVTQAIIKSGERTGIDGEHPKCVNLFFCSAGF